MRDLINKIIANSSNQKVLKFIKVDLNKPIFFCRKWDVGIDAFDEGGSTFFEDYGKTVPAACKYIFESTNIMVNPASGVIFAFHIGRFSMFFRCDFERSKLVNADHFRKGFTFDCIRDITELGENWSFLENFEFEGMESEQLRWAFEKVIS